MVPTEKGVYKHEIQEELETAKPSSGMKLIDYIPIYIPTIEKGLIEQSQHERRFLDFLKAHPSKDWFVKFGFVGRLSPFSFLRRNGSPSPSVPAPDRAQRGRFRVPFFRKIEWKSLIRSFKRWIKKPANIALFIWLLFFAAGLIMLFLFMTGILNQAIPSSTRRKKWTEVINQIFNALIMIMCLYQHPKLFHHLVLLCRWKSSDRVEIRRVYCKDGAIRPHERAHLFFVVILLHITCISQYVTCGLYWGYTRHTRPDWAVNLCIILSIASPVIAGVYVVKSPLGKRYENGSVMDQESQRQESTATQQVVYNRRIVVTEPEWIGGLFDCCDDPTVACWSFFCTFCVFGWNMERLGFGNMYVHIFTFILLCIAPFLIFGASALNIEDDTVAYTVVIIGAVLCLFGLLYGGVWRTEMRKRFKLPSNRFCCGSSWVTDYMQWWFCWSCSLAQEVRTANFYDIEDESFCKRVDGENGGTGLFPLPREEGSATLHGLSFDSSVRSFSCPPKLGTVDLLSSSEVLEGFSPDGFSLMFERASTLSKLHVMTPPLPPLIQQEDD